MSDLDRFEHDAGVRCRVDYGKVVWSTIPVGPESVVAQYLLRIPRFLWWRPRSGWWCFWCWRAERNLVRERTP